MTAIPVKNLCKRCRETIVVQLGYAKSKDEELQIFAAGLEQFGFHVLPALKAAAADQGNDPAAYLQAQQAVLDLLSWLAIPYVRSCREFNRGVALFDQLLSVCIDQAVRHKLTTYSNQLKSYWHKNEPGGLSHNPRAVRRKGLAEDRPGIMIGVGALVLLLTGVFLFGGQGNRRSDQAEVAHIATSESSSQAPASVPLPQPAAEETVPYAPAPNPGTYRFTDDQGVLHLVDHIDKVPPRYRKDAIFSPDQLASAQVTRVQIDRGNHVLVPVTLHQGSTSAQALLLLDTGCTTTTISEELARRLNLDGSAFRPGKSVLADGRSVAMMIGRVDQLAVGGKVLTGAEVSILPRSGATPYDGLLGMNFLRQFRYQIDYDNSLIRWQ